MADDPTPTPSTPGPARPDPSAEASAFEREAAEKQPGLIDEFVYFIRHNKKWWLTPIVILLMLFGLLVLVGNTGVAPFIYAAF